MAAVEPATDVPNLDSPEAQAAWEAADAERRFWEAHYTEYLEQYPEQFVAVKDGAVVANSPDLMKLLHLLQRRGLAPTQVWIRLFSVDPHRLTP
jgi:hypothetical protein